MVRFTVYTETGSVHQIDVPSMTYVRMKKGEKSNELRRDGEPIPIRFFAIGDVGEPLVMSLWLREDGAETIRTTSAIVRVVED